MISAPELLASLARLTVRTVGLAGRPSPTPAEAEPAFQASAEPTLIARPTPLGDALIGLAAPVAIDPTKAALSIPHSDQLAHASRRGEAAAPDQRTARPIFGAFVNRAAKPVERSLSPEDIKVMATKLRDQLTTTPDLYLSLVNPSTPVEPKAGAMALDILNAAMLPGWPAPLAMQAGSATDLNPALAALFDKNEAELLECAAALGADEVLQARLKAAAEPGGRTKLLRAVLFLAVVIGAFLTALRAEIEELLSDSGLLDDAAAPEAWGGRIRLPLE